MKKRLSLKFTALAAGITLGALAVASDVTLYDLGVPTPEEWDAKQTISAACNSSAPLLVLDFFSLNAPDYGGTSTYGAVDVDGDKEHDMSHGDLVAAVARLGGKEVRTYGMQMQQNSPYDDYLDSDILLGGLLDILDGILDGSVEKPAAIIMSITQEKTIDELHALYGEDLALTSENIIQKREEIQQRVTDAYLNVTDPYSVHIDSYMYMRAIQMLNELGVPVITSAGNDYDAEKVNMFGIYGGVTVGSLTHDGNERAPYSNDSSLATVYEIGDFIGRQMKGGIDINGDDVVDFPSSALTNTSKIANMYNGVSLESLVFPASMSHEAPYGFFDFTELATARLLIPEDRARKDARLYGEHYHLSSSYQFRTDKQGNLRFDPANDGDPTQVSLLRGTSYAAPNVCN